MSSVTPSVISSHPGKQVFVYQTVFAFQRSGLLKRHFAATYYQPGIFPHSLVRWLPAKAQASILKELKKRQSPQLDQRLITSFPYVELLLRALRYLKPLEKAGISQSGYILVNVVHDLITSYWLSRIAPPTFFYGFQGAALHSIKTARKRGSITILDSTHPLSHSAIMAEEYARLGFKRQYSTPRREIQEALNAHYCVTASALSSRSLTEVGVPPERIFQIPYGVDLEQCRPRPELRSESIFRVLFVGKISVHKGFHYLLEAWQGLSLPNSELVLVGNPTQPLDLAVLRRYNPGLYRWVRAVDDIYLMYASADVFVLPSLVEGFGMVTLEAMASGVPVIVTENANAVVRDGLGGYVVPIRDVDTLQDRIRRLYDDASLRKSMGEAARKRAEEFTWQRYHTHLVEMLETVLGNQQGNAN